MSLDMYPPDNVTGNASQTFSVAPATAAAHAVRADQLSTDNTNFPIYTPPTAWVPTLSGITQVGAVSNTFTYIKIGRLYFVDITISAATSTATTAGTSTITLPSTPTMNSTCVAAIAATGLGAGTGFIYGVGAVIMPPTISVGAGVVVNITGVYYT